MESGNSIGQKISTLIDRNLKELNRLAKYYEEQGSTDQAKRLRTMIAWMEQERQEQKQ